MYFANPLVLWALLALLIPIIIHLFNFRRFKKIYFSNVSLLREIKIDTQSTNRLKHLLVLSSRLLALFFLIFAFAQPFLKSANSKNNQGSSAVSIFVDNSFSMNAENKNGILLESAKKSAKEIVMAYKPSDKFQLLTNDFEGRHQRLYSRDEFVDMLGNVQLSASSKNINQIYSRQADVLVSANQNNKKAYIITDLQESMYNITDVKEDSTVETYIVPIVANQSTNIFVDSIWFESPNHQIGGSEVLHVKINATGTEGQSFDNIPIKLYVQNEQISLASFSIETPATTTLQLNFTNKRVGQHDCRIEIQDHPITFDDNFFFSYLVSENITISCINGNKENEYLNSLFSNDPYTNFTNLNANTLDYSKLNTSNFIILNEVKNISSGLSQEIEKFCRNGGGVLTIPSIDSDIESYNNFFRNTSSIGFSGWDTSKTEVVKINLQHSLYNDIFEKEKVRKAPLDLPKILGHYSLQKQQNSKTEPLLELQNGESYLYSAKIGKGKLFVCTSPFNTENSNFVKHALFVPSIYKMAITSIATQPLYYKIGIDEVVNINSNINANNALIHLTNRTKNFDIIPAKTINDGETVLKFHNQINEAANYQIECAEAKIQTLSFNYNNLESNLTFFNNSQLEEIIEKKGNTNLSVLSNSGKSITQVIREYNTGKSLWKICLLLSLFFLLIEVILLSATINKIVKIRLNKV